MTEDFDKLRHLFVERICQSHAFFEFCSIQILIKISASFYDYNRYNLFGKRLHIKVVYLVEISYNSLNIICYILK